MKWKHYVKPDTLVCPQEFCFFWDEKGNLKSEGLHNTLNEALIKVQYISTTKCSCSFGKCIRDIAGGDNDWFEPVEPLHEKCWLPIFYFCDYDLLNKTEKEKYNQYFSNKNYKRVIVKLKLSEELYAQRKGHLKNSVISAVAVFDVQKKLNSSDVWSIVAEIHEEANEDRELKCSMRFLVEEAPKRYLDVGSKFVIRDSNILADGIVIGEET